MSKEINSQTDLVGMYAFILSADEKLQDKKIEYTMYIAARVNENNYLVQMISPLTGERNIAKIVSIGDMLNWTFVPDEQLADHIIKQTQEKGWKYSTPF